MQDIYKDLDKFSRRAGSKLIITDPKGELIESFRMWVKKGMPVPPLACFKSIFDSIVVFKERYIIDNHLNNNNWLRQHGQPMIRKGHPFYKECKSCKITKLARETDFLYK